MNTKPVLASLFTLLVGMSIGLPAQAEPPSWAPAHGHRPPPVREYRYTYYPAQQVYYAPQDHMWFWLSGKNWQAGVTLPTYYRPYVSDGVPVVLNNPRPYVEHVYVEDRYGRPWREKHHHGNKHGHDRHDRHENHRENHHDDRDDSHHRGHR